MQKRELRKLYDLRRRELSPDDIDRLSAEIARRFGAELFKGIRFLHIFYPMTGKHEFNSLLLAERIRTEFPDISLVLPKSDLTDCTLKHIIWETNTPLAMNAWGITEPEDGMEISAQKIDMVVIPLLAFDIKGNRLGYGKGFYDRFLSECREDIRKVGVSFFPPEEQIAAEEHDIPLDLCITPERIWSFKPEGSAAGGKPLSYS